MTKDNTKSHTTETVNSNRARANYYAAQAFAMDGKQNNINYCKKMYAQLGEHISALSPDTQSAMLSQIMGGLINITYCIENVESFSEINYPDWERGANMMRFIAEQIKADAE